MRVINVVVLSVCSIVLSGCATCLDFNDQTPGSQFYIGDVITTSEISINVEQFQWGNGIWTSSGHAKVDNRNYAQGSGIDINANNVTLHPQHAFPVEKITFVFGELGGNINININGVFQNTGDLISLNGATIGETHIVVNATQQDNNWYGDMTIEGNISDFSIGGQELWVDDYCYTLADCLAADSDVTTGTLIINQSFNETRAVLVTVLGTTDRVNESLTLKGLNISGASSALVGARIYDEGTQILVASSDITVPGGNNNVTVSIPISTTLVSGQSYRIGFYVQTDPLWAANGNFFQSDSFSDPLNPISYTETTGIFQINSAHAVGSDSFPANWNIFTPQLTIRTRCP